MPQPDTRLGHMLAAFQAGRLRFSLIWVSNGELVKPEIGANKYGARIKDLRDLGHVIILKRDPHDASHVSYAWLGVKRESKADTGDYPICFEGKKELHNGSLYTKLHTSDNLHVWTKTVTSQGGSLITTAEDPPASPYPPRP